MKKHFAMMVFTMVMLLGMGASFKAEIPSDATIFNGNYYKVLILPTPKRA